MELAYKHYISQVEAINRQGLLQHFAQANKVCSALGPCGQLFAWPMTKETAP
jgi:hypothetical protein